MSQKEHMSKNGLFNSRLGFVLASVGSAVGMGNIWMFPYRVGKYGGAAFLLLYFIFVILFGLVGLSGEFAFGRLTRTGPIGSYDYAMKIRGKKGGKVLGAIPLIGSLGIAIGYAVIVGWILKYLFASFTGAFFRVESEQYFADMTGAFGSTIWHALVILITVIVLNGGVTAGIEKANRFIMPTFFILFLFIAVWVFFLEGSIEGYKYLLIPKWEVLLNPETWVMAMGQAFFSLSITGSGMIIYGSYLDKKEDIPKAAMTTAFLDTIAALLAGFVIIPAVFAFQMDPKAGPPLLFITLPKVFEQMPMGRVIAAVFFLSVLFAGITSLFNMFEVCAEAMQTHLHLSRKKAVTFIGILVFGVGIFIEYEPYLGKWMDFVSINLSPFGAALGAIMVYWVMGRKHIGAELDLGREKPLGTWYYFIAKYIYVLLTIAIIILSIVYKGIG